MTPTPPAPAARYQLPPASWVPAAHAAAAAALGLVAVFWQHPAPWVQPALVLGAALVFVIGISVYLRHRDRWSSVLAEGWRSWLYDDVVPELRKDIGDVAAQLPPELQARLAMLEKALALGAAASPALAKIVAETGLSGPQSPAAPAPTLPQAPAHPAAAPAVSPGAAALLSAPGVLG
jgi:hypothetical protein